MIEPQGHIDKARRLLAQAHYLLAGDFADGPGRDDYMAAFHAALAYIVAQIDKEPKTHSGVRSEFARLARGDQRLSRDFTLFLARGYELKATADYDSGEPVTDDEARRSLVQAIAMVDGIAAVIAAEP